MGDLVDIRQAEFVQSLQPYTKYVSKLRELENRPLLSFVDVKDVKKGLVLESSSIEEKEVRDAYVGIFRAVLNQVFRDCDWCRELVVMESSSSLLDAAYLAVSSCVCCRLSIAAAGGSSVQNFEP